MEDVHTGSISFWDQDRACLDYNLTEITFGIWPNKFLFSGENFTAQFVSSTKIFALANSSKFLIRIFI